jgi:hypothetical protein
MFAAYEKMELKIEKEKIRSRNSRKQLNNYEFQRSEKIEWRQ